jgi:hypothetical protein
MQTKEQLRDELKQQLVEFAARGGKVELLPYKDLSKEKKAEKKVTG